jgi:hypothetical protein
LLAFSFFLFYTFFIDTTTENDMTRTADQIFEETLVMRQQMQALLQKNGKAPRAGSCKAAEWGVLADKLEQAKREWANADRAERHSRGTQSTVIQNSLWQGLCLTMMLRSSVQRLRTVPM